MSGGKGAGRKTPAHVQVFFFEKKRPRRRTDEVNLESTRADTPAGPSDPFSGFPPQADAAHDPTVRTAALELPAAPARGRKGAPSTAGVSTGPLVPFQARPWSGTVRANASAVSKRGPSVSGGGAPGTSRRSREGGEEVEDRHATDPSIPLLLPAEEDGGVDTDPGEEASPEHLQATAGEEALEYHRQKLIDYAARAGSDEDSLTDLALFAHALFARGRIREAQVVFESIVAREPDEAFAYTMLGAVYHAQGDAPRALALFDLALGIDPSDLAARVGRAEIRLNVGDAKRALKDLERAIAADPAGRDPFSERARALSVLARTLARSR